MSVVALQLENAHLQRVISTLNTNTNFYLQSCCFSFLLLVQVMSLTGKLQHCKLQLCKVTCITQNKRCKNQPSMDGTYTHTTEQASCSSGQKASNWFGYLPFFLKIYLTEYLSHTNLDLYEIKRNIITFPKTFHPWLKPKNETIEDKDLVLLLN